MNSSGRMFFIKESIKEDFTSITEYLTRQVTWTLEHPLRTMDKDDIQSFLKGTLQIYVEFWNATDPPFGEYAPELPSEEAQTSNKIDIFTEEILSIFKFITEHFHCPWVNNLRSIEKLQKLNMDLRSVLENYFKTNIWSDWKDISALHPQSSSPSSSLFRMESYKCTLCNDHHAITKEEKHEYLVRAVSAVCILIRDISEYPCLNAASTADHYSTTRMQYNSIKILKKIYKITVRRLSVFDIYPAVKLNLLSGPLKHFERSEIFFALCDQIYVNSQQLYSKILHLDIDEMCMEKLDQTLQVYSRLSKCLQNFVAFVHPSKCVRCS